MSFTPTNPSTQNLCGTFADPATRDPGREFSAAISPSCEAPTDEIADDVELVFIDGQPQFSDEATVDTGTGLSYAEFNYTGTIEDETVFGGFVAPAACRVLGVQAAAETPSSGDDIAGCLVDEDDNELSGTDWTISEGERFENTDFATALTLAAGAMIKAKIKRIGTTEEGGYLNVRLVIGPAT